MSETSLSLFTKNVGVYSDNVAIKSQSGPFCPLTFTLQHFGSPANL